jgi:hypothetical protein
MPSPAALTGVLTVSLHVAHKLIGFVQRKRLAALKNPYAAFLCSGVPACTGAT